MRTRACWSLGLGRLSFGVSLFVLMACEPATPHPGGLGSTGAAPVDAAVDRVLLGVGGTPACNSVHPSGGTATGGVGGNSGGGASDPGGAGTGGELDAGVDARPVDAGKADASSPATGGGGGTPSATGGGAGNMGGARGGATGSSAGGVGGGGRAGSGAAGGAGGDAGGVPGQGGAAGAGRAPSGGAGGGGMTGQGGTSGAPAPQHGDLAIVELLINPASTDTGREWIELVNRTSHPLDLSMLHIADAANDAAIDFGSLSPVLGVGARAVLIQSADVTKNGGISLATTRGGSFGTRVSLNNDADTITVCVGPCASGVAIDQVSWDATLVGDYDGHALVIDDAGHRCPATVPFGDAGSFGTPGGANAACP